MVQWLQPLALLPLAFAARLRRLEARTIARVIEAGATSTERGVPLERNSALAGLVHRRLQRAGVLAAAGNDLYFFNRHAYALFRARRRRRALIAVAVVLMVSAMLFFR